MRITMHPNTRYRMKDASGLMVWSRVCELRIPIDDVIGYQLRELLAVYGDGARRTYQATQERDSDYWKVGFNSEVDAMEFYLTHHKAVDVVAK